MPREVFRDTGLNIIEFVDINDSEGEPSNVHKQPNIPSLFLGSKGDHSFKSPNSSLKKTPLMNMRRPVEIIELSSSSDEDILQGSPSKRPSQLPLQLSKVNQQFTRARKQSDAQAPTRKLPNSARRKQIIMSSSEDDDEIVRPTAPSTVPSTSESASDLIPDNLRRADVRVGNDGIIQYTPTPRRPVKLPTTNSNPGIRLSIPLTMGRRRTLLEPDPTRAKGEDLSWEHEQDGQGGVRFGAMLTRPVDVLDDEPTSPSKPASVTTPLSSPTKTARQKKMPEAVAVLHRFAIPYLKELDSKVFNNQLGASYLPELEPPHPCGQKQRGRNVQGILWGMGTRGEYNDGKGSYIELLWSNRMATTAGRTEYKKTAQGQIITKIELGVKVITNEERLRHTLAHEACHAASWAISGDFKQPHGATFKSWGRKVMAAFPGVEVTTKHDYEIAYKFSWRCLAPSCGHIFQRHSNSIDLEKQGCFCGSRLQPQFQTPVKRTAGTKMATPLLTSAALGNATTRASPHPFTSTRTTEYDLATALTSMTLSSQGQTVDSGSSDSEEDGRFITPE